MRAELASPRKHEAAPDERGAPRAVLSDERSAFVRTHVEFVWRAVRRFGVPEAEAPDATQQVFIVATAQLGRIEKGRERAFLFGTALRIASKVRRRRARKPLDGRTDPDEQAADLPSTEELVDQRRARAIMDDILERMADDLRAVFVLYELEQMTMAEIADLLSLPSGTVASRLRRAREFFERQVERRAAATGGAP
jgi:RNA polymerase sigma-70 factor (ECF subfamily)